MRLIDADRLEKNLNDMPYGTDVWKEHERA